MSKLKTTEALDANAQKLYNTIADAAARNFNLPKSRLVDSVSKVMFNNG